MADWEDAPDVPVSNGWEDAPDSNKDSGGFFDTAMDMAKATPDVVNRGLIATTVGGLTDATSEALKFKVMPADEAIVKLFQQMGIRKDDPRVDEYIQNMKQQQAANKDANPVGGSEWIGQKMEDAGMVSPTRRPGWELAAGLAPAAIAGGVGAVKGIASLAGKGTDVAKLLMGGKMEEALSTLKSSVTSEGSLGEDSLRQSAYKTTEGEKAQAAAVKDIEDAKFQTREKVRASAVAANREADDALSKVSANPVTDEQFGSFVSEKGQGNVKTINEETERAAINKIKDPAFAKSRTRAQTGDYPATNPSSAPLLDKAAADIRQTIADTPAGFRSGLEKRLQTLFGEEVPLSEQELRVEQLRAASIPGYVAKETKQLPLTLHQMEYLRRWAKDPILRERTGFGSLDDTRMKELGDTIREAMTAYEPDVKRYIDTYRSGKEAEELALGGRGGESAIETFAKKPQQIASYYLDGTKSSADKLVNLVGGVTPELTAQVAGNVHNSVKGLDAAKTAKFLADNAGLFEVFPEVGKSVEVLAANRAKAEQLTSMLSKQQGRLGEALKTTSKIEDSVGKGGKSATAAADSIKMSLETLDNASGQEVISISKQIAKSLRESNLIDEDKYQALLSNIRAVGDSAESVAHVKKLIKGAAYGVGLYGAAKTIEFGSEAIK